MKAHVRGLDGKMLLLDAARVLPALVGAVALGFAVHQVRAADASTNRSDRVLAHADRLQRKVIDLETALRGYAFTRDASFLAPMLDAQSELPDDIAALRHLVRDDPAQTRRARDVADSIWSYQSSWLQPALRLGPSEGTLAAQMWAIVGRQRMEAIRE